MKSSLFVQQHFPIRLAQCIKRSLVTAVLLACVVAAGNIYAQEVPVATWYCGIKLTVSGTYNMTNDITCPNGGLKIGIEVVAPNVTLNLQGHSITGPYSTQFINYGLYVRQVNVAIKGPGSIKGFYYGITLLGYDTISHVQLESNSAAIYGQLGANEIFYNTVRQGVGGGTGIAAYQANNQIVGNMITGTDYGIYVDGDRAVVTANSLSGNKYALFVRGASMTITGNDVSSNSRVAAAIYGSGTIRDNHFNANSPVGLQVVGGGFVIQNNTADNNTLYGISCVHLSNSTIASNTAIGNGELDLQWDGYGTGNTWSNNNCDTWSVNMGDRPCVSP